jgi:hypothetical protein
MFGRERALRFRLLRPAQRGAQKQLSTKGGGSRFMLELSADCRPGKEPSICHRFYAKARPGSATKPFFNRLVFFGFSSTCYSVALTRKKRGKGYVDGRTYTVRADGDVDVIQLTKRSNR